jgi:ABC-type nitrate/sulfonate/bicarbonate transport system permease component
VRKLVTPLESVSAQTFYVALGVETLFALLIWFKFGTALIPGPLKVLSAAGELMASSEFYQALVSSLYLTVKGMAISMVIALFISYAYFLPLFRPLGHFIVKCRYLTLTGLIFLFTLLTSNGSELKLSLLVFGIVPFFVTSLISQLDAINVQEYELCKTMRMSNWEAWTEVIIIGRMEQVVETLRQNFAIAWLMITMIEGLSMSEGGLGVLLLKANKYVNLPRVFALMLVILLMGIFFDFLLGLTRTWLFPHTRLQVRK